MSFTEPYFLFFHPDDNVADSFVWSVQTGTEDPDYPLANLTDFGYAKLAAPSKLLETAGAWQGDGGAAVRVDAILAWHDFNEAITAYFDQDAGANWAAPTLRQALTIPAKRADGYSVKVFVDLRTHANYTALGRRYVRLAAVGASDNPIGLKVMLFSQVRSIRRDFNWGIRIRHHQVGIDMKTDAGHAWAYDLQSAPRLFEASGLWGSSDLNKLVEWNRAAGGIVRPVAFVPYPSTGEGWIGRFEGAVNIGAGASNIVSQFEQSEEFGGGSDGDGGFAATVQLLEVTPGDPEWL